MSLLDRDVILDRIGACESDEELHQLLLEAPATDARAILDGPPIRLDPCAPLGGVYTLRRTRDPLFWPWPDLDAVQLVHPVTFARILARAAWAQPEGGA